MSPRQGHPPRPDYGLLIINVSNPSDSQEEENRRLVRSHTTQWQHRQRREQEAAAEIKAESPESSPTITPDFVLRSNSDAIAEFQGPPVHLQPPAPPFRRSKSAPLVPKASGSTLEFVHTTDPTKARSRDTKTSIRSYLAREQHRKRRQADRESERRSSTAASSPSNMSAWDSDEQAAMETKSFIENGVKLITRSSMEDASHQLSQALQGLGWDLQETLEHYVSLVQSQTQSLEAHFGLGSTWQDFFLLVLTTDPALVLTTLLVSGAHKLQLSQHPPDLIDLHGFVITSINEALREPDRAVSDQMLMAVTNLAVYEAMFGSKEVYHIHMEGLKQMVNQRGGLSNLGLDGLLERVILWDDANCAALVGCRPYFDKAGGLTTWESPQPDIRLFTAGLRDSLR